MAWQVLCISDTFNHCLECSTSPTTISPQAEQSMARTSDILQHLWSKLITTLPSPFMANSHSSSFLIHPFIADTPNIQEEFTADWNRIIYSDSLVVLICNGTVHSNTIYLIVLQPSPHDICCIFDEFDSAALSKENFTFWACIALIMSFLLHHLCCILSPCMLFCHYYMWTPPMLSSESTVSWVCLKVM